MHELKTSESRGEWKSGILVGLGLVIAIIDIQMVCHLYI